MTTRDALNSTILLALARLGVPVLVTVVGVLVGVIWNDIVGRIKDQDTKYETFQAALTAVQLKQAAQGAVLAEHERRLNSRNSPISGVRDGYGWRGLP